jgi:hypothetical protein
MRQGISQCKRDCRVEEIRGSIAALDHALSTVQPGELLLLQADEIDVTVNYLREYLARNPAVQEVKLPDAEEPVGMEIMARIDGAVAEMLSESPPALQPEPVLAVQDCGG